MERMRIYTDGGCHGNPGPGAWAFVLIAGDTTTERSGAQTQTTNNRMELTAVIEALRYSAETFGPPSPAVDLYTDSQYVRNGITQWIHAWIRNGWLTSAKKPVKNRDLWQALYELQLDRVVHWNWLKGHAGHPENERCDDLVQHAIEAL